MVQTKKSISSVYAVVLTSSNWGHLQSLSRAIPDCSLLSPVPNMSLSAAL